MVNASFKRESGSIVSVNLNGHAGFADEGYDMVCSAVSAVSLTIANGITEVLKVNPKISVKDGFLNIDLKYLSKEDKDRCQILLETMLIGLKSIEMNYRDYISVEIEEV